jgi:hypothetical protein
MDSIPVLQFGALNLDSRDSVRTINRLLMILDREDLAAAQARLRAGYGSRVVK